MINPQNNVEWQLANPHVYTTENFQENLLETHSSNKKKKN